MKIKKEYIAIIIAVPIAVLLLFLAYKAFKIVYSMITFKAAIAIALTQYSIAVVRNAEKITRLESNNFVSNQWNGTYSAGMQATKPDYPYGWDKLKESFWDSHPQYNPVGTKNYTENETGKKVSFVQFPNPLAGLMTLCEFLSQHDNNPGTWFSDDNSQHLLYDIKLESIKTPYTDNSK